METGYAITQNIYMAMSAAISVVPHRSSRTLSDFSDIAHLTVAFHGMRLSDKQKLWIKVYAKFFKNFMNNANNELKGVCLRLLLL